MRYYLVVITILCGCTHQKVKRSPAQEIGSTVIPMSKFFWAPLKVAILERKAVTSSDESLSRKIQSWVDQIHDSVAKDSSQYVLVPRPKIRVVANKNQASWVSPTTACFSVPTETVGASVVKEKSKDYFFIDEENIRLDRPACMVVSDDLSNFVHWYNTSGHNCSLRLNNSGGKASISLVGCSGKASAVEASGFIYLTMAHDIVITTATLLNSRTEEDLIQKLLHILGHYYNAHAIKNAKYIKNQFWYQRSSISTLHRPIALENSIEISKRVEDLRQDISGTNGSELLQEFQNEVAEEQLAFYSFEHEADIFMLEQAANLGYEPRDFALIAFTNDSDPSKQETCLSKRKAGWLSPGGIDIVDGKHFGQCYRLFNMDHQVSVQKWQVQMMTRPKFKESFTEIKQKAQELGGKDIPITELAPKGAIID